MKVNLQLGEKQATLTTFKMYVSTVEDNSYKMSNLDSVATSPYELYMELLSGKKASVVRSEITGVFCQDLGECFVASIKNEDHSFTKRPGCHPYGLVVKLEIEGLNKAFYGVSVRNYKDKWSKVKSVKYAYHRLKADLQENLITLSKTQLGEIFNILFN
jgi:hypothetical protein